MVLARVKQLIYMLWNWKMYDALDEIVVYIQELRRY